MEGFGALIEAPRAPGARNFYSEWLGSTEAGLTPRLHVNYVSRTALPHRVDRFERHPSTAQIFLPRDVSRYLAVIAPSLEDGSPDIARARAFVVPGTLGIVYAAGVWHAGATALDRSGHFAVLMWRDDSPRDEEFRELPSPLSIDL